MATCVNGCVKDKRAVITCRPEALMGELNGSASGTLIEH